MTNSHLAKIEKKKVCDPWDDLRDQCLPVTTTAPVSAVVQSLPPASDPVPDTDIDDISRSGGPNVGAP